MKRYFSLLLLIIISMLIIGCNQQVDKKEYVISFNTYTEQKFNDIVIDSKQTLDLPTPTRIGYSFDGWYPNEKFIEETKVTNNTVVGKTITLYAKWTPITVTITLNANGGKIEEETAVINTYANEQIILPTPKHEDPNYLFDGWYDNDYKVKNPYSTLESVNLVARFIDKNTLESTYKVSFALDGGNFYNLELTSVIKNSDYYINNSFEEYSDSFNQVIANFLMQYNQTIQMPFPIDRWYFFDFSYRNPFAGANSSNSNADFFNNWRWLYQYLAYVGNNKEEFTHLYLDNLARVEAPDWTISIIRAEISAFLNANCFNQYSILSADYSQETIRMGYVNLLNLTSYKVGEVTPLLIPIKEGYTFMGWYDNPEFEGLPVYEIDVNCYGDKVYYAKWN